jgi:hypothetical protein
VEGSFYYIYIIYNNTQKRFLLFLIGCIGARSLFVIIAKNISLNYLPYLGYLALIPEAEEEVDLNYIN